MLALPDSPVSAEADVAATDVPGASPEPVPAFLARPRPAVHLAACAGSEPDTVVRLGIDPEKTLMVPAGVRIKGEVVADALYLCGEIEGQVTVGSGAAIIAPTGRVIGSLIAGHTVCVAGAIEGQGVCLRAAGEIDIGAEGRVHGDIEYTQIKVRAGAVVEGRLTKARP